MPKSSFPSLATEIPPPVNFSYPEADWYVIHTCCHHEIRVEGRLQQIGMEVFLPRIKVVRRWRDRKKILDIPLFPGYLFVHDALETSPYYHQILKVPGVVRVLGEKHRLAPVDRETIDSIKISIASDRLYYPWPKLPKGKQVRIIEGPLAGVIGVIRQHKDKKRKVIIEVELFRRSMAVELDDEAVEPWHP